LFVTIKNAKVISDSAVIELIKSMRFTSYEQPGAHIFNYGTSSGANGSPHIDDMEAFIVIKGRVGVKAPRLVKSV